MRIYKIQGESMTPSLGNGDLVIVSQPAALMNRGTLVVLPDPRDSDCTTIKRVVGLPGEQILLAHGIVLINGRELDEPYLGGLPSSPGLAEGVWNLCDNELFVLGDNRAHSTDSRNYGAVASSSIIGHAWFRFWPIGHWGRV